MRHDYGKIQYQLNQYRIKKKEAEKIRDELQAKLDKLENWEKSGLAKIWVQQSIGIISRYNFYDFFRKILQRLLEKKKEGFDQRTFEQYVFSMVFEIPCPSAGKLGSTRFDKWKLTLPEITDLPYVNVTHYDRLL
jgi:hypothetical protein